MKNLLILLTFFMMFQITTYSQIYKNWETENIEEFYEKVSVKSGTLSEDGKGISYLFIPTEIKEGVYEVEIADFKNDLYEIKGTGYYVKFRGFYGFAGFGEKGVLEAGKSAFSSKFYKRP